MSEIAKSGLLEYILENAEEQAKRDGRRTTAEYVLFNCFEACVLYGDRTAEKAGVEKDEIRRVKELFEGSKINNDICVRILENLKKQESSYMDGVMYSKLLINTQMHAEKENAASLTADRILQAILNEPSQIIRDALQNWEEVDSDDELPWDLDDMDAMWSEDADRDADGESREKEQEAGRKDAEFLKDLTRQVKEMQSVLSERVLGQEHAVSTFVSGYFQSQIMLRSDPGRTKPGATFLFAGPPGVGKTFLAERAAEVLGLPFCRFDMSEYADGGAVTEFSGAAQTFRGAKPGNVTSFVYDNPRCLLLFDEIEKANIDIIHLFLQILDAGRLRDNYMNKEVSFRDAVIILTTNAGRRLYEESREKNLSGIPRKTIIRALREEVSERTRMPAFPAAICSRFAAGNVVMFNHMEAHTLRHIAMRYLGQSAAAVSEAFGLEIGIDKEVATALLFSEGGNADARMVTGRAETFLNAELFELFRLMASESSSYKIDRLKKIRLSVNLSESDPEITELFYPKRQKDILVFAPEKTLEGETVQSEKCVIHSACEPEAAGKILKQEEIAAVFIEPAGEGGSAGKKYLNIEDVSSPYMEFYRYICTSRLSVPVYILQTEETVLSEEEKVSFMRTGARGICISEKGKLAEKIAEVCERLHQQESMDTLARYNKVLSFDSAQQILDDGETAEISFINFGLGYALDADDRKKVLADVSKPDLTFGQVIGAEDVKEELKFFADYLKHPRKYVKKGLRPPKGVLLYGPPGTGKTMLAKAMAAEADMTFITAEGGQFLKKYVGEGPEAVHDLFRTARKYAPAILFIDEIDAIGKPRTGDRTQNIGSEVLNALLTEMDGFRNAEAASVFVLAATNFDVTGNGPACLDAALVRRFDRRIKVELPNSDERRQFLEMKCRAGAAFSVSQEKIDNIVARSTGMSLALLDSVLELSQRSAVRCQSDCVTDEILEEAFETYNSGREKKWDPQQLERTARHEAGHALLCWKNGEMPAYLTIVARADHGGYMQQESKEDKGVYTKAELLGRIRTALAGRAAEIVCYGEEEGITTGASGDLQTATGLARYMICSCGMDEEAGMSVIGKEELAQAGLNETIRKKINKILAEELKNAEAVIRENREILDTLTEVLMKENHIDGNRMKQIFENAR